MARVTVEDCIEKIDNRFELVLLASQRARKIGSGAALTVDRDNDKNTVVSLREIAQETLNLEGLKEELILSHQRFLPQDSDEDVLDAVDAEQEWADVSTTTGIYSDEEVGAEPSEASDDDAAEDGEAEEETEPSLSDIAGA